MILDGAALLLLPVVWWECYFSISLGERLVLGVSLCFWKKRSGSGLAVDTPVARGGLCVATGGGGGGKGASF